ncbi:MAG: hypothetical protein II866_11105 [Prevotella sp.]|nr:hypothetical protein [Prevotella sp.]
MKKSYIKPAMSVYPLPTMQLLAGSGPNAGDQNDPSMAPTFDDELELEFIPGLEIFQM